jgi:hypothetical protein
MTPATATPEAPLQVEYLGRAAQAGLHQRLRRQQRDVVTGGAIDLYEVTLPEILDPHRVEGEHPRRPCEFLNCSYSPPRLGRSTGIAQAGQQAWRAHATKGCPALRPERQKVVRPAVVSSRLRCRRPISRSRSAGRVTVWERAVNRIRHPQPRLHQPVIEPVERAAEEPPQRCISHNPRSHRAASPDKPPRDPPVLPWPCEPLHAPRRGLPPPGVPSGILLGRCLCSVMS